MSRFLREPVSVRNAASAIVLATLIVVVVSGVAMRALDHREYSSIWEGMWWALQTVTTVGYGDVTPKDVAGKLLGGAVMLEGIAFLAIITAAITSNFVVRAQQRRGVDEENKENLAEKRLDARFEDMTSRLDRVEGILTKLSEEWRSSSGR